MEGVGYADNQCPLWVKSRHVHCTSPCPLYPRKRHQTRHMECPLWAVSGHSTYSITSSARASRLGGTERPSALAVLRLITSSELVGACRGRLEGLWPFIHEFREV